MKTKEEARKFLIQRGIDNWNVVGESNYLQLDDILSDFAAQSVREDRESRWISVEKDGLPKPSGTFNESDYVLCYWERVDEQLTCWYDHNIKAWFIATYRVTNQQVPTNEITHWQPLPSPPINQ